MKKHIFLACFLGLLLISGGLKASELVYEPINPSFGGNPLNSNWMVYQADSQNKFKGPTTTRDPLDDFEDSLNRRILSMLASEIVKDAFGGYGEDLQGGHYQFGDYDIDIATTDGDGITVNIFDNSTGNSTTITVPYYY